MSSDGGSGGDAGRMIGGRYRLVERIGSGGMGTVWRAHDELVDREVAVKQPRLPGDPQDEHRQRAAHRLYREARAAARVDHPCAVTIHDVVVEEEDGAAEGVVDGLPWIVMELVRGESLHEVLRRGTLEPAESARIGLAVLGALRAAHAVGIVHRDVKPANVLLGPHGRVVLTDFGIAHVQGEESLTATGEFVGSLEFVAPERLSGGSAAGPASDLWSLGVLLYAAVTGESPFRRTTVESTLAAILAAGPPEPKRAGPLGPLVVRLLERDPERRPAAQEVAAVLEAVAEGRAVSDNSPPPENRQTAAGEKPPEDAGTVRLREREPEDAGTVRLREGEPEAVAVRLREGEPEAAAVRPRESEPEAVAVHLRESEPETVGHGAAPEPASQANPRRRTAPTAPMAAVLLGALLLGGTWLGVSSALVETDGGSASAVEETTGHGAAPGTWKAHRERDLDAVLSLPSAYTWLYQVGEAKDPSREVVYGSADGTIAVSLTRWTKAPRSPMAQAGEPNGTWGESERSSTQYTRTSFDGREAVLADTTYDLDSRPTRVMELVLRTDANHMYELRVSMPKGTPDEKQGTAVFKGARDRLEIEKD
ncbi:protein kinase [Streptomyces sp. NPDC002888]|uniref:serine/threonine-protein kinase n=1 Tax=Streptomyces sp. NPDC002888 TaxID=3364668 RepID=UPI0036AC5D50